jgi:hypothetical protein
MWDETEDRQGGDALPAPRLSHDAKGLPLSYREIYAVNGLHRARLGEEMGLKPFNLQKDSIPTPEKLTHESPFT